MQFLVLCRPSGPPEGQSKAPVCTAGMQSPRLGPAGEEAEPWRVGIHVMRRQTGREDGRGIPVRDLDWMDLLFPGPDAKKPCNNAGGQATNLPTPVSMPRCAAERRESFFLPVSPREDPPGHPPPPQLPLVPTIFSCAPRERFSSEQGHTLAVSISPPWPWQREK